MALRFHENPREVRPDAMRRSPPRRGAEEIGEQIHDVAAAARHHFLRRFEPEGEDHGQTQKLKRPPRRRVDACTG